ncbi:hypothetical protein [Zhongshania sp.]|uniref:hypothetical protein n=1 Tax=Zhongshania sp. TaxID=1971902 RepID=UPI001B4A39DB|nr:hypothetical protein [Zhongshania sp.]MBQ0795758.1 hypothetical protein [Zhongshania sp.]
MPFLGDFQQRRIDDTLQPMQEYSELPTWDESFGAALGVAIDEELSISSALNRQGWAQRRDQVRGLIDSGEVDHKRYSDRRGRFDYDRLAAERDDIKSDSVLGEERKQMLASRRTYAESVLKDAPMSARFLGSANAYLLDPISIATMPISAAPTAAKSLSVLSRASQFAGRGALLEGLSETAIQAFVFDHKNEIDSPHSVQDAIAAIATAATGGAVLNGLAGGIGGYLRAVREQVDPAKLNPTEKKAFEYVQRTEDILDSSPYERTVENDAQFMREIHDYREARGEKTVTSADFEMSEKAYPRAKATSKQTEILERTGLGESYDSTMDAYSRLESKTVLIDDEQVNADDLIEAYDYELNGLENVMRCVRG